MDLSEDSLRQALARLGGGKPARPPGASHGPQANASHGQIGRRHAGQASAHAHAGDARPDSRRRRFVQDGQVVVEHQHSRSATVRGGVAAHEDQDEIERLKQSVRREQRRCEDGERALADARSTIRALETRAAHADLHAQELDAQLRQRDERIAELLARISAAMAEKASILAARSEPDSVARETRDAPPHRARAPQSRRTRPAEPVLAEGDEPEPVKWWIRK